jgi:hypothetical protein
MKPCQQACPAMDSPVSTSATQPSVFFRTPAACKPESRYFCRKIFSGILLEKIGKNHATAYAFGAPIRPRHLVPTQQGVGTLVLA